MSGFVVRDPDFAARVTASFHEQPFMHHIGAELIHVAPGETDIRIDHHRNLLQQHGYFHGGITGTIADNAAGFAATSLFDARSEPLTVEFKISLVAPARGDALIARGRVIKSGRTLTTCRSDVFGLADDAETLVATGLVTIMRLEGLSDRISSGD